MRWSPVLAVVLAACPRPGPGPSGPTGPAGPTAPALPAAVRFIAVGDTGKGNEGQRAVGRAMAEWCRRHGCDFVALLGDNVYPSGVSGPDDPRWEAVFETPYAGLDVPFYVALGNHDYGGNGSGLELEKGANEVAYSRVNPRWVLPADHHRFQVGGVDFFVANTTLSMFRLDAEVRRSFAAWRATSWAPWRVVFGHHPLYSNGRHGNAGEYDGVPWVPFASGEGVKEFLEDEVCGWADLYISGHDHHLEWLGSTCGAPGAPVMTELILSGGGATATPVREVPRTPSHWRAQAIGFLYVEMGPDRYTGTFVDPRLEVLFTRTVERPGVAPPAVPVPAPVEPSAP